MARDGENSNIGPSSSGWFVVYGLDRVVWLAWVLGLGVLMSWNRSDMHLTSGAVGIACVRCSYKSGVHELVALADSSPADEK